MKIVQKGTKKPISETLIGKLVQCPECECLARIEFKSEIKKHHTRGDSYHPDKGVFKAKETSWCVVCPDCKEEFPILVKTNQDKPKKINRQQIKEK